jgi:hypothetical protein
MQTTPAFVESPLYKDQGVTFFASQVTLGPNGAEKIHPVGELDASEQKLIEACLPELKKNIEKGVEFVHSGPVKAPKVRLDSTSGTWPKADCNQISVCLRWIGRCHAQLDQQRPFSLDEKHGFL